MSVESATTAQQCRNVGVDPAVQLPQLEFAIAVIRSNPMRSTVASRDVADLLDLTQEQATTVLEYAAHRGLVERWSGTSNNDNPKYLPTAEVTGDA